MSIFLNESEFYLFGKKRSHPDDPGTRPEQHCHGLEQEVDHLNKLISMLFKNPNSDSA